MKNEEDTNSTNLHEFGFLPSCQFVRFVSRSQSVSIGVHPWLNLLPAAWIRLRVRFYVLRPARRFLLSPA